MHRHGPRSSPCPGSNLRPVETAPSATDGTRISVTPPTSSPQVDGIWSPTDSPLIKYIPNSARSSCAALLPSLLRASTTHDEKAWLDLFS